MQENLRSVSSEIETLSIGGTQRRHFMLYTIFMLYAILCYQSGQIAKRTEIIHYTIANCI